MLLSVLLASLNRLAPSRGKHRPQRAGPNRRGPTATRLTLPPLTVTPAAGPVIVSVPVLSLNSS